MEAAIYTPNQVLEIIYEPKSLWERMKNKTKKMFNSVPKVILSILTKIFKVLLGLIGLNSGAKNLIWHMIPTKAILQWIITFVSMFFPMLGPLITMGSRMIL